MDKVNLTAKFAVIDQQWSPKIVGEVGDVHVKLAKIQGEFVWHSHEVEDEMFLVVKGRMTVKLRDGDVNLAEGEFFIVPKGVEHCPVAIDECQILMIEPKGTLNTGDAGGERTVNEPERI
ncbi:MAG: cupin domain-containing protein [Rhodospirillales bacterium]|jgi:mannose-6-phosphate isomerase-like protein (cupin superfamily)|nr:cupin domain-containing protein [Rhodospirillales bacterium]